MAKEADLRKIELKVSVNCCDGCKRKVKKVLQSVEGVLKTEIDPVQPKVTVLGDVDPQILIKRLVKAGKQAEVTSNANPNGGKEKKEAGTLNMKDKEVKSNPEGEQAKKSSDSCDNATDKSKQSKKAEEGGDEGRAPDKEKNNIGAAASNANSDNPEVIKCEIPVLEGSNYFKHGSTFQDDFSNISKTGNDQYGHEVKPYAIALPIYAMASLPPTCSHDRSVLFQQQASSAAAGVGDYFSDDNAIGCHAM